MEYSKRSDCSLYLYQQLIFNLYFRTNDMYKIDRIEPLIYLTAVIGAILFAASFIS